MPQRGHKARAEFAMTKFIRKAIPSLMLAAAAAMAATTAHAAFGDIFLGRAPARGFSLIAAQTGNPAQAFVQQNIDKGFAILNNKALSEADRREQFSDFVLSLTDQRRIGMFTLGQYANGASKADTDAFIASFTEYAVAVYQRRLDKYAGQTLKVTGSVARAADDVVVNANVVDASGQAPADPIQVGFRVRADGSGRQIVTDLQVEGIWLAISQRAEFTDFLQKNNGSLPALTANLRSRAEQIRSGAQPA